jgi:hypothetical protein
MNCNDAVGAYLGTILEVLGKPMKITSQDNQCTSRDSNWDPTEYK